MKKRFYCTYSAFLLLLVICFTGIRCKKFVEVPPSETGVVAATAFSDDATALSTMAGLYSRMVSLGTIFTNGGVTIFTGLSADELANPVSNPIYNPFVQNAIPAGDLTTNYNRFWARAYFFIYQANAVIEGVESAAGLTENFRQQLRGEAKFIRAFCYFYLVNLYGDVPLQTTTDYRINAVTPRAPVTTVYAQMEGDLLEALNILQATYPAGSKSRPTKWAAAALLARVYLYQQKWAMAEAQAAAVIQSSAFSLEPNLNGVYLAGSREAIWQLVPAQPFRNTEEGFFFIPVNATTRPVLAVTPSLLNAFETGDQRKTNWLKPVTVGSQTWYYPFKYKVRSSTTVTELYAVLRLAEQYLIRAEARAHQNNTVGARADLNAIRQRAGLAPTLAADGPSLLDAIERERRVELMVEWGHRWLDLKRTGRADAVLAGVKGSHWQPTDALYPIPLSQLQLNTSLVQNPGY